MKEGGVDPRILNFGTRWKRVVSFTPPAALLPGVRAFGTYSVGG